jgi:uncharacterized membrane protein
MEKAVGEFVMEGEPLVSADRAWQADEAQGGHADRRRGQDDRQDKQERQDQDPRHDENWHRQLCNLYSIGVHRTVEQDVGVGIGQLADIAVRAMSPAINDTNSASACVDYLTAILARVAERRLDSETDSWNGQRTLILRRTDFHAYLRQAFEQIRQHANGDLAIYLRLLGAFENIACCAHDPAHRNAVEHEARLVIAYARTALAHGDQQARAEQAWQRVQSALEASEKPGAGKTAEARRNDTSRPLIN